MSLLEDHTAAFIVRIWRENGEPPGATGDWRGSIEHVMSGRRAFFRDLGAIANFMKPHLDDLGIDTASRFWELMSRDDEADAPATTPPAAVDAGPKPPASQPRRRATARR
jgi:hypothetical protein